MDYLNNASLLAAAAVVLVQQILKLKIVPLQFANRFPVPTNIVLSIVASIFVARIHWDWSNLGSVLGHVATIAVTAAIAYNQLLARWSELKSTEG